MQQFNFKVVRADDEAAEVPVPVAGQVMMDIQSIITHTGELLVRQELRTQSRLQDGIEGSLTLRMEGQGAGPRRDGDLLEDTLGRVFSELDRANLTDFPPDEVSTHIEAASRRDIARDILALADHLDGYTLYYGADGRMRRFRMNARAPMEREASRDVTSMVSAVIGVVSQDPQRRWRWLISNGMDTVPVHFADTVPREDIAAYPTMGPLIVTGRVVLDQDGRLAEVRDVTDAYVFPLVKFHRIVTPERDISLLNPVVACLGYRADRGLWTLESEDIGISVSKPSWDEVVWAFHGQFVFLWETYVESDGEFEGEELDVSTFLRSLAFP